MGIRGGAILILALSLPGAVARAAAGPAPQDSASTCLVCHDDAELKSSAGTSVYVDASGFAASVHGRAGCVGCHADLAAVEDFPHAPDLAAVSCARCHPAYARATAGGVHGTSSPRLAASPVACRDCHGHHDIRPSADPASPVHRSRRPAKCGRCHGGAGPNFARGRVHELASGGPPTPAGVVRVLYKALIAVLGAFFVAYIVADLSRSRRVRR